MMHEKKQIQSLLAYVESHKDTESYIDLYNGWTAANDIQIHDPETIDYYLSLIPDMQIKAGAEAAEPVSA